MLRALAAIFSALSSLLDLFFGPAAKARKAEQAEARAREAESAASANADALALETRMQEAQRRIAEQAHQETPHEGTDLFKTPPR